MSTQIRFRRGTTAQHAVFTGALAEITVDTDKKTAVIHDGGTAGGIPLAREDGKNDGALGFQQDTKVNDYTVLVGDIGKMLVGNKATAINFPLSAAATLTSKFVAGFKNINAGTMTVTPNGAELIDGVNAAITIPTGASVVIKGDGSSFRTFFSNGDTTGAAINNAPALTGANIADNDKLGLFDVSAGALVSVLVSELIAGIFKVTRKIANSYFLSSFRLWDTTDNTKGLGWVLSGIATATTRFVTMPDRDVDLTNVPTPWVAYTPTFTGFGTPTNVSIRSRRVGSNLEIQGSFTSGTPTGVTALLSLGFNGVNGGLTVANTLTALGSVGVMPLTIAAAANIYGLALGGDAAMKFGIQSSAIAGLSAALGTDITAASRAWAVQASIPIQGW
jgi:hypothetical protein